MIISVCRNMRIISDKRRKEMISFESDYNTGAHPMILKKLSMLIMQSGA